MERSDVPSSETASFGHYRVTRRADGALEELGRGGMGVTYRALDPGLRIPVALKVIGAAYVHDTDARRRFQREASAAAQLRHPNVASVLHLGEQGDEFFYAMEFVAGRSLLALLKEERILPVPIALALMAQVAAALAAAHKHELIHRDLKPGNLMLLEGNALDHEDERTAAAGGRQVKVIDFGLARSFGQTRLEDSLASVTGALPGFMGTPSYSSPEQCAGSDDLDGRSDLYSLGIVLWQCVAGRLPFSGTSAYVLGMHQYQALPMDHLTGLPAGVVELLTGLLEKSPAARRPRTAAELRDALDALRHSLATGSKPATPGGSELAPATGRPRRASCAAHSRLTVAPPLGASGGVTLPPGASA